jgi:hypothetical protein
MRVDQCFMRVDQRVMRVDQRFMRVNQRVIRVDQCLMRVDQRAMRVDQLVCPPLTSTNKTLVDNASPFVFIHSAKYGMSGKNGLCRKVGEMGNCCLKICQLLGFEIESIFPSIHHSRGSW